LRQENLIIPIDLIYKNWVRTGCEAGAGEMRGRAGGMRGRAGGKGELRVCWPGGLGYRP
jgi:hypothetical protein